mgnify:CR=1 FL=1
MWNLPKVKTKSNLQRKSEKRREVFREKSDSTGRLLWESIRAEKTAVLQENVKQKVCVG